MVGMFALFTTLSLANQQVPVPVRMVVFGGPTEPAINRQVLSQAVKKSGTKVGWNEAEDGTLIFVTQKQISYVFLPSLREIATLRAIRFFREKLEKGGLNQIFAFSELPQSTKATVLKALSSFDVTDQSSFTFNVQLIPNISSSNGRSVGVPLNLSRLRNPSESQIIISTETMAPIKQKEGAQSEDGPRPVSPSYQIWPFGTQMDSNRTEMINEAMSEFKKETSRLNNIEVAKTLEVIKDEEQVKGMKSLVGQGLNFSTQRPTSVDSLWASQVSTSLRLRRDSIGLQDNQDWDNFTQHAQIDSLSAGFSLVCVQLVNGQRRVLSFDFSL